RGLRYGLRPATAAWLWRPRPRHAAPGDHEGPERGPRGSSSVHRESCPRQAARVGQPAVDPTAVPHPVHADPQGRPAADGEYPDGRSEGQTGGDREEPSARPRWPGSPVAELGGFGWWWALLDLNQRATDYEFWAKPLLLVVRPRYSIGLSVC